MAFEAAYIPVMDEQDKEISYTDDSESVLLPRSSSSDVKWRTRSYTERRWNALAIHALLAVFNVTFLIGAAYLYFKSLSQRPGFLYSPAQNAIEYEARTFNTSLFAKNRFNGYPTEESSAAWKELTSHENAMLSKEELSKLNRNSVEVEGSGYLATLGVFHQLHCLNYIRKQLYPEYYTPDEDEHTQMVHKAHCIDNLRQIIQCHGDTSVLTYSWRPDYENPWPDFQIQHECRNFNKLVEWADSRATVITKENLVNPYLDPNEKPPGTTPTQFENSMEVVEGTRLLGIAAEEDY